MIKEKSLHQQFILAARRQAGSQHHTSICEFIKESNKIEGIYTKPDKKSFDAYYNFIELDAISISDLKEFVEVVQPDAALRDSVGSLMNVRVGSYIAPPGGKEIAVELQAILDSVNAAFNKFPDEVNNISPVTTYNTHLAYERLHPFTDGNGRSGRVLWLWMMLHYEAYLAPAFLKNWYYQTLQFQQGK